MYSGTTLNRYSGRIIGAHQKVDRLARKQLGRLLHDNRLFPGTKSILHFEGKNGPDGIKRKSPSKDEPWHFFNPFDDTDQQLVQIIEHHYQQLVQELRAHNRERAAFEAAWLAHALVDGLTPAHHYPYEEKMAELRGGKHNSTRTSIKEKLVMHGDTRREKVRNNWKMWGPKGLITTHGLFEFGTAILMAPLGVKEAAPSGYELRMVKQHGVVAMFRRHAREVAVLDMYHRYYRTGWTPRLAYQVRHTLAPILVQTVTLAWYAALHDAGLMRKRKKK